jgi:glycerophosphoryl diester phosphodiesterase
MRWLVERPIAHRGLHDGKAIPENSMPAFEAAVAASTPIELDVHLLADGKLAVFHDEPLERLTGAKGRIEERTAGDIKKLRLLDTSHQIPLLDEVLDLVGPTIPVLIDIKSRKIDGVLEALLSDALEASRCTYAVESFNPVSLRWFKKHAAHVPRGQLSGDFRDAQAPFHQKFMLRRYYLNFLSVPDFLAYDIRCLPNRFVARERRRRNIPLLAWTVKTEEQLTQARQLADNVIFEGIRP